MNDNRRVELDTMVERALRDWASEEVAPERVWKNIRLALVQESERSSTRLPGLRHLWMEACYWGAELLTSARILLIPSLQGVENGWTERLVLAGQSNLGCRLSIKN